MNRLSSLRHLVLVLQLIILQTTSNTRATLSSTHIIIQKGKSKQDVVPPAKITEWPGSL